MHDISDEKRSETALHESEEKYRSLVERASDGILIIQDGIVKYVNPHLAQLRGQSADEIIGTRFEAYIHPDERPTISERYRRRLAGEDVPATYETVLVRVDQSKVYAELSAGIVSYEGRPANLIVVRDVTERKQAENVQNAIYEIARSVISTASLDELYRAIHQALEKILPVDNFYIALYDPLQNLLSFPYFVDQYDAPAPPQTPGRGLTEYVLRTRKPLLATAQVFAQLLEQGEVEPVGTDSVDWLGVPLNIGEKIVGVMVIQTYTDSVRLVQRDLDIMSFVSTQVAIAIERVRAEQATSQRTKELKALYDTSLDIISTHDLPILLETIVERAARLLNASSGGLYLCDAERREVRCVVSYNTLKDYRGTVLKYGEGAAGTVAETGKPLKIDDYRYWSKRAPVFDQEKPFTALISVPIFWQGASPGGIARAGQRGRPAFRRRQSGAVVSICQPGCHCDRKHQSLRRSAALCQRAGRPGSRTDGAAERADRAGRRAQPRHGRPAAGFAGSQPPPGRDQPEIADRQCRAGDFRLFRFARSESPVARHRWLQPPVNRSSMPVSWMKKAKLSCRISAGQPRIWRS